MKNNEMLHKFANNKKLLYLAPNLIYTNILLSRYNLNKEIIYLENMILLILLILTITIILQFIVKKISKNNQTVFYVSTLISLLYMRQFKLTYMLIYLICGILIFVVVTKMLKEHIDTFISIAQFIIIIYFCMVSPQNVYSIVKDVINTKYYDEKYEATVEDNTLTPNIYWIHTDAMMSFDGVQKYFKFNNIEFKEYLKTENFQINENAFLVAGHKTQNALAALYNPDYYDNFLKEYLYELEEVHLGNKISTPYNISTKELAYKRINSELLTSLKEKNYTTVAISKFNNYSSLNTDVFYDFYNYSLGHWHFTETEELRKIAQKSIDKIEISYRLNQIKEGLAYTIFSSYTNTIIPYEYELLDYNILNTSDYPTINDTKYWQIKAILKSLEDSKKIETNKFVFIDYDLNHTQLSFDGIGNVLEPYDYMNINRYIENYIYSYRLLMEMINYIKANDSEAIIVVQSDHGLHTFEDEFLQTYFGITIQEVREIRNSVMNAIYVPEKYQNGDEKYLSNPLNISRYLINNYVGKNYEYLKY